MTVAFGSATLRTARFEDGYALWLWANDSATRLWSGHRDSIPFEPHMTWLRHRLADQSTLLLISEDEAGTPLGSVRFETINDWQRARLSYVIAPRFRGQGRSRPLVSDAMARLMERHAPSEVWADVIKGNAASLKVFRGLGWGEEAGETADQVTFRWRP